MRDFLVEMTWFVEEAVGSCGGSSFSRPRFGAAGSGHDGGLCDSSEEIGRQGRYLFGLGVEENSQTRSHLDNELERAKEADLGWPELIRLGRFGNQKPDEIIGGDGDEDFFFNHVRGFAFKWIHAHIHLDRSQMEFGIPTA